MIRNTLKKTEYLILKWYLLLHLEQQRMLKLYSDGGITRDIVNRELRSIYFWMRVNRKIDNILVFFMAKAQSISLEL